MGIREIGKSIPYAYLWLLKNDKNWLVKTNATRSPKLKSRPYFNYPNLDQVFYKKINDVHERLVSAGFKGRISKSLLRRSANVKMKLVAKNFPLTTELLEKVSETSDGRRIRLSKRIT